MLLQQLRAARSRAELSQQELAEKLDTLQSVISKIEIGERRLDLIELRRFCRAMEISVVEFVKMVDLELERLEQEKNDKIQ